MNEVIPTQDVERRIYRIRGQRVMLDSDLANLYGVPTFRLNEQVRRNLRRLPFDFMFRLTSLEVESLRSQYAILKTGGRGQHKKYFPYAFTEQGVAMLSGVLRSQRAIDVNIAIMRAFVKLRHAVLAHQGIARRVEKLEGKVSMHDTDIRLITQDIRDLKKERASAEKPVKGFRKD
jgi:hypothetical protein